VPTLRKWIGSSDSQQHPNRVRLEHAGRCVNSGLRSFARKPVVVTPQAGSATGPQRIACVHAVRRSVGELTASDTRRVWLGAKWQYSGKESVANSHAPPFFRDREVSEGGPIH